MPTFLHVVTGKGGTGKTTVAGALAVGLAQSGKRVLLCEVEDRQGIAQLLDVPPLPYEERRVAVGSGGGEVYALAIDARSALLEYLELFYRLGGRAGKTLDRFGIIDFATTIAPGVRDVLLTGKVYEAAWRRQGPADGGYDAVVVDAPPTGRISNFLNVNNEVAGLAKVGPIRRQADSIMEMMRAPTTAVHLVTILEEMPVQETVDGIDALRAANLPVGAVVVNAVRPPALGEAERTPPASTVAAVLAGAGLPHDDATAQALVREGDDHLVRQRLQTAQREALSGVDVPVVELPWLADGIDLGALYDLGEPLRKPLSRVVRANGRAKKGSR